jgi:diguanylate cyclase (GGDEF)-like protein/PAS domain S-box-containing protein
VTQLRRFVPHAAVCAVILVLYLAGGLEALDRRLTDARFSLVTRQASSAVTVVMIDPRSLVELDVWPWPRGYHATILEHLLAAGATKVAFDVDFSSRSTAEEDAELERALAAASGRAILPVFAQGHDGGLPGGRMALTRPLPQFTRQARLAAINVVPDADGLTRSYPRGGQYFGQPVPSLAVTVRDDWKTDGTFHLDFGVDAASVPRLSYVDVLTDRFDHAVVAGRAVIVGSTAVELGDQLSVPRYGTLPGALVQALAVESLAQGRDLGRSSAWLGLVLVLGVAAGIVVAGERLSWRAALGVTLGLVLLLFAGAIALQWAAGLLLDVAAPVLSAIGVATLVLVQRVDRQTVGLLMMSRQVRESEHLMRHVVSHGFDAIVTLREDGTVMTFNHVAQKMFGCGEENALGRSITEFIKLPHAETRSRGPADPRNHRALYETDGRSADGRRFPIELAVTWIVVEGARRRVMFLRDITERKAQQEALRYQATHDALTDLPNRNLLQERIEDALIAARRSSWSVAFLLLDLDRFKEINDTLGHHVGDLLLRKIARRLEGAIRESDTIARLGGDEFAVLLPATGLEKARQLARGLIQSLEEPFQVEGLSLQVETSVGITMYPENGNTSAVLVRRADVAMYVAKRERTGLAIYDPEQDFTSIRLLALTSDLRRAIQDGELRLHYQPKLSARTGGVAGVEALARWRHPEHGDIAPDEFIGLAEHSGLIRPLTTWVMETALKRCAEWRNQGIELPLSINLSARNLLDESLPKTLNDLLGATGTPRGTLTLEITESVIMEDPVRAKEVLTELHELGITISIDDFGTGYSSLGYLRNLPADELKIDRSFVMEMDRHPEDSKIVRSTIELAHNLGLRVVAEGVQSRQVWEELKRLGCDYGQGYFFSRPLPGERIAEWCREREEQAEAATVGEAG